MARVNDASGRSEWALRGLAALLAVLFLAGMAACGGDVQDAEATVADRAPAAVETIAVAEPDPDTTLPDTDPASEGSLSEPITSTVSYDEAEAAYHGGDYDEATGLFAAYTTQKPQNPWGFYMLGLSAWKAGELDEAEVALAESVRLDPNHVKGHVNLARVLLDAGDVERALQHAIIAEDIDPTSGQAKRTLARARGEGGDVGGALVMYEEALWIDPEDTWSLNNMGYLLVQEGRFEEAVGPLALAVSLEGDRPVFLNNLGAALEGAGHVVAAARAFEGAAELDPGYEKAVESAVRLAELVSDESVPEVDVVALGDEFRTRLAGAVEQGEAPKHGEGNEVR